MSSFIGRFFKGIKEYFKPEFRYYTITFFFFVVLVAILAPIFLILDIKDHSFNYLLKSIRLFNPDILWIAGKIVIDFLKENAEYF